MSCASVFLPSRLRSRFVEFYFHPSSLSRHSRRLPFSSGGSQAKRCHFCQPMRRESPFMLHMEHESAVIAAVLGARFVVCQMIFHHFCSLAPSCAQNRRFLMIWCRLQLRNARPETVAPRTTVYMNNICVFLTFGRVTLFELNKYRSDQRGVASYDSPPEKPTCCSPIYFVRN